MKKMARQDQANDEFSLTSFLYGGNADYLEQLQAAYEDDPQSVDPQWQDFFAALKDDAIDVRKNAKGASWSKPSWPLQANGELVSALDGNWGLVEKVIEKKVKDKAVANGAAVSDADILQATRDSVRAIMMIRAFRMRGHLHANLDPLGIAKPLEDYNELSPSSYGFTEADYGRKIFIDGVLGLEYATIRRDGRHPDADLLLDARRRVHAHLRPRGEGLDPGAYRGHGQGDHLHRRGQEGDPARS